MFLRPRHSRLEGVIALSNARSSKAFAEKQAGFRGIFGPQRSTSYFSHVSAVGKFDIALNLNHRAMGSVAMWPNDRFYREEMDVKHQKPNGRFYREEMDVKHRKPNAATSRMMDWLRRFSPKLQVSSIFFHVADSTENRIGTSYVNQVNGRFVRELVAALYRDSPMQNAVDSRTKKPLDVQKGTILTLTGYLQQKFEYMAGLKKPDSSEVPQGFDKKQSEVRATEQHE
ncbi:hypothetical protein G7Z17_g5469 [Cylindrodendrum hubeiense]|uniref:DNA2/NAM7 helicase-like C-terminal domain-containing protein n=1 Tax=Cylindrodendrum hubeiense TaxID=595255 RepID=A0A9P5L921_9HYPO|nr:hypothetical protein G7Z17_g5469 [Cylindrodendrum hubeiense]